MTPVIMRVLVLALAALMGLRPASAQDIAFLAPRGLPASAFPAPQRTVADIVSPTRSTEKQRDAIDEAGQLTRLLDLQAGMSIGDIGAGSGYHTVRLSPVVGPGGRIIAQDVRPDYLRQLASRAARLRLRNVTFGLGEPHDPRLPAASLDAAILVHMYHEVAQPYAFLYNLAPALKPGRRVGIVDLDKPTAQHGTPINVLRCELAAVGYREVDMLKGDAGYLAIFTAPEASERKDPASIIACRAS